MGKSNYKNSVSIDGRDPSLLVNDVKVMLEEEEWDRHITITHEGVVVDLVKDGEVIATACHMHDDLAPEVEDR